jgi:putative Holliday junction resolvase
MNNTLGDRVEKTNAFKKRLEKELRLPVTLWDERLSTVAAERALLEADLSRAKRKQVIDKQAAVFILQGYLDSGAKAKS